MSIQNMSIFIPKVFSSTTEDDIKLMFGVWEIGNVSHVDFIEDSPDNYRAYVHFTQWYNNPENVKLQIKMEKGEPVKKYYFSKTTEMSHCHNSVYSDEPETDEELTVDNNEYGDDVSSVIGTQTFYWILLKNKTKKYNSGERKQTIDITGILPVNETKDETVKISTSFVHKDYYEQLKKYNIELQNQKNQLFNMSLCYPLHYFDDEKEEEGNVKYGNQTDDLLNENRIIEIERENAELVKYISQFPKQTVSNELFVF